MLCLGRHLGWVRKALHCATVDMTTAGLEETTVVTATVLGLFEELLLAGKTTVCFWVGTVEIGLDAAAAAFVWV